MDILISIIMIFLTIYFGMKIHKLSKRNNEIKQTKPIYYETSKYEICKEEIKENEIKNENLKKIKELSAKIKEIEIKKDKLNHKFDTIFFPYKYTLEKAKKMKKNYINIIFIKKKFLIYLKKLVIHLQKIFLK